MLSKRTRKVLLQTGVAIILTMSSFTLPVKVMNTVVAEAAVLNTQSGNLTVTASSLWAYNAPDWSANVRTYSQGTVLQVVEKHLVDGKEMYRLTNGYYISANPSYVTFSSTTTALSAVTSTASADTRQTLGNLNMRSGAGSTYGILLTIPQGTTLTVQSLSGTWAKVSYGGKTGYVSTTYLKTVTVAAPATPAPVTTAPIAGTGTRVTTGNLNMRSGAGSTYGILLTIPQGTTVTVQSLSGTWAKVSYGGKTGYVSSTYLKTVTVAVPAPVTTAPIAGTDTRVTTGNLNMRSGAGSTYGILLTIPQGTTVTVQSLSGTWAKVSYGGKTGYVSSIYLKTVTVAAPVTPAPAPVTTAPIAGTDTRVTTGNLNMRSGAGSTYGILLTIPQGTTVTVQSLSGTWAKVSYGGKTGYVSTVYLKTVVASIPVVPVEPVPVVPDPIVTTPEVPIKDVRETTSNLNLRSGPETSYAALLTIPQGTQLVVEALEGAWAKVTYSGSAGYVSTDYLKVVETPAEVVTPSDPISSSTIRIEAPTGTLEYNNVTVKGYVLTNTGVKSVSIRVNGIEIGLAEINIARADILEENPTYTNAATSGYQLVLDKDRFNRGSNIVTTVATLTDGTTASASSTIIYNRPEYESRAILDSANVVDYKNVDIRVSGYARIDSGVKSVRVSLNGRAQGTANYGIMRDDADKSFSGYDYLILRNNLFPGQNTIKVEITGNAGESIILTKVIEVEKVPTVIIDAGHGGKDSGGRGILNGAYIYEKVYAIKFAAYLSEELRAAGINTIMTRTDDTFIELADRAKIGNDAYADLFFSIHHDYSPDPASQGAFVIYPSSKPASISESTITESVDAAGYIKKALVALGFKSRNNGTDQAISGHTLAVLRQTNMRSILAEIGYMSNPSDLLKITDPMVQKALAKSMADQIIAYFGMN